MATAHGNRYLACEGAPSRYMGDIMADQAPDTLPPDDPRNGIKAFAAALGNVISEFSGPDWDLSYVEVIGMLEVAKSKVFLAMNQEDTLP